ncbi:TrgA family protein [Paracoccaceae bacterium Fryx2]|nr:TrgA family protein [Paracoccaceae bacterium Fryx2]
MPTAAKLFAAIAFAAVAFLAAELFKPAMPEGTRFGPFSLICAGLGAICGWVVMGKLTGRGYGQALGFGVRTSVTIAFWALLGFSLLEMVNRSTRMRYDGPMEALTGGLGLMLEYGQLMLTPPVVGCLLLGGALGGAMAEWAGKRWR